VKTEPVVPGSVYVKTEPVSQSVSVKTERTSSLSPGYNNIPPATTTPASAAAVQDDDDDEDKPLLSRLAVNVKQQAADSDDDLPLTERLSVDKRKRHDSADSDTPLAARVPKKSKVESAVKKKRKHEADEEFDVKPSKSKVKRDIKNETESPKKGRVKKEDNDETKWKWWEEEKKDEGTKWKTLEHKGPLFAPAYEPLPANVKFYYDGKVLKLSESAEEVAGFYARMLDHDYTTRELFNNNFFKDWRKMMSKSERELITNLSKCNFKEIAEYYKMKTEERKNMTKEEKQVIKKENEEITKQYGFCIIDGHKQKIGNFRIEPPGLFRGRGDHPKQGMLKRRVVAEDVIINCSKGSKVPEPPPGHKWKEVRHDNTVTWLASWTENVQQQNKYVMLNAASKLKGEKDWMKYETARKLHKRIDNIRATYREDLKSKEMRIRQRAVALYFIDKLALRAGNEKDEDQADTVGCCSLRVEHVKLHEEYDGRPFVVEFDFLGKDSIRYYNRVEVDKRVFKNLQLFMDNKQDGDDLFDRLNTAILNKHLASLMDGLTAKVFRTYNASHTLQQQLDLLSQEPGFADEPVAAKLLAYNRANRAVAVLCNHQRAVPKNFGKQMENLQSKIDAKKDLVHAAKKELKDAKADAKASHSETAKNAVIKKQRALDRAKEQLMKLEMAATDKDENKEIALSTSKLNYLDPRISIAWCKKWEVPIEKVYNKTQREKFAWAIDMADEDYEF